MDPAPAETAIGDPANRSPPDVENNEKMPVQEHADADDLYQDISAPNGEDELNRNPCASNGKHSSREREEERRPSQPREESREPKADRNERSSKERSRHRHRDEREDRDTERPRDRGRSDREKDRDRDRDGHRDRDRDRDRERRSHRDRDGDDRDHRSHRRHRDDRYRSRGDERSEPRSRDEHRSHGGSDRDRDKYHGRDRDRDRGRDSRYGDRDHDRDSRYGDRYGDRRERSHDREADRRRYDDREHSRKDHDRRGDEGRESRGRDKEERKPDLVLGGYKPRQRSSGAIVPQAMDPFAAVRAKNKAQGLHVNNPLEVEKARNEQQAKARQMVLQQQAISTAAAASKTQREVYIGNLQQGKVTEQTLRQLFDEALSTTFPHLLTPGVRPCLSVAMHSEGRYAFVELATPEMATAALQLSGQLNFLGSQMTVGRPSGYIDPAKAAAAAAAASKALQEFTSDVGEVLAVGEAPPPAPDPTQCLCIDHMVGVTVFTDEEEYQELVEDLHEECGKHGTVVDTRIPCPDRNADLDSIIGTGCYGKVYCLMDATESAINIQSTFNGRVYDGRKLHVSFIQPAHFYMLPVPIAMQPEGFE